MEPQVIQHVFFDWGGTLMSDDPARTEPMYLWPDVRAYADVPPALARLSRSHRLHVATNALQSDEAMIRKALSRVGLDVHIERIFCYRALGLRKADPGYWPLVLQQMGIEAAAAAMVGDSYDDDALPAARAGLQAWWLNRASTARRQGPGITTLHTLDELFRA